MTCSADTPDWIGHALSPRILTVAGVRWSVSEAPNRYDRRTSGTLVFECLTLTIRVRHFPANWRALSDVDLWDLAWQARE